MLNKRIATNDGKPVSLDHLQDQTAILTREQASILAVGFSQLSDTLPLLDCAMFDLESVGVDVALLKAVEASLMQACGALSLFRTRCHTRAVLERNKQRLSKYREVQGAE